MDPMLLTEQVADLERLTRERNASQSSGSLLVTETRQEQIDALVVHLKPALLFRKDDIVAGTKLVRIIGKGNFGVVWQATDVQIGEPRAVKVFDSDRLGLGVALYHFRRGVRAMLHLMGQVDKPRSIVDIFATDLAGLAFTMPYLEGHDLSNLFTRGWDLEKKLSVFRTVANATAYAHSKGVIHRDIKPANIVLTRDSEPVLTDFDIADLLFVKTLSSQGSGSIAYAAPEQLGGRARRDPSADVYSLGRLLHFMLLEQDPEITFEHLPALDDLSAAPNGLVRIIRKCTMRDPDRRYQTVNALLEDVEVFTTSPLAVGVASSSVGDTRIAEYAAIFGSGLAGIFEAWRLVPTPESIRSHATIDSFCGGNIAVVDTDEKAPSLWHGGPPYRLNRGYYTEAVAMYERLHATLLSLMSEAEPDMEPEISPARESSDTTERPIPGFRVLIAAIRAVPSVKYALGVAGVVSAIAVVRALDLSLTVAGFGAVVMFVLMTALVVFSALTRLAPHRLAIPATLLLYAAIVLTVATSTLLFTSVFFMWPIDLQFWLISRR